MSDRPIVLDVREVSYRAGPAVIVDGVRLQAHAGEIVGLLGPNGAGKSTLLKTITGELQPASGVINLHGRPLQSYAAGELAALRAVVTQHSNLNFPFTAREVVMLGATVPGFRVKRPAVNVACDEAMRALDVAHLSSRAYPLLSGGERQRIQIARALCQLAVARRSLQDSPLLLLDEPTSSLDIAHQRSLLDTARALASAGGAIIIVMHDLNLASAYCDRLVMMVNGRVRAAGAPADVIDSGVLSESYGCEILANTLPRSGNPFALPVV
jgi:iron complex transport system ATP-binding protein